MINAGNVPTKKVFQSLKYLLPKTIALMKMAIGGIITSIIWNSFLEYVSGFTSAKFVDCVISFNISKCRQNYWVTSYELCLDGMNCGKVRIR